MFCFDASIPPQISLRENFIYDAFYFLFFFCHSLVKMRELPKTSLNLVLRVLSLPRESTQLSRGRERTLGTRLGKDNEEKLKQKIQKKKSIYTCAPASKISLFDRPSLKKINKINYYEIYQKRHSSLPLFQTCPEN